MADTQTIPPPPDPGNLVPDVKRTGAERIGGFLGAISGGGALGSISDALERHHQKRLAEAKMYHDVMVEKLAHPAYADANDPEHQKTVDAYNAAKQAYLKSAGVDKETKQQIQQRTAIAEHHVGSQGQSQPAGGAQQPGGMPPPPSPSASAGGPAGATAGATGAIPPPPKPDLTDIVAGASAEQQRDADRRAQEAYRGKVAIDTEAKIKEEQAKPSPSKSTPASDAYFSLLDQVDPETGEKYTPQKALKIVTDASAKAGRKTPFQEYMDDPEHYKAFQAEMAKAKQSPAHASIGAVYGIYRMMEMGYRQNPEILPIVAQLAPQVFASAGMKMPPAMAEALGKVPLDQPLSPVTGAPIGTSMPGAPTAGTRTQAQTAARIITGDPESGASPIEDIRKEIKDLKGYLGPTEGRINVKYLLGKVGSTGDPKKDQALSQLRTDLTFLASAAAKFHLNSVRAMEGFEALADAGKDSSAALDGFLNSVEGWAKAAQRQERGAGERGPLTPPPSPGGSSKIIKYDKQGNRM